MRNILLEKHSRTKNTFYNFASSMGGQFLQILLQFLTRTVFIATLGKSYLGIGSLFSNILSLLSLTEFGVGSAILFKLYEPIANEDHHRIVLLMKFYKSAYRIIGIVVAVIGLCLIPFLPSLIRDYDRLAELNINAVLILCIYLLKNVSSYLFFAYKSAIIQANQKGYIINIVGYFFQIIAAIIQIICLFIFRSFILYVLISVAQVIGNNYACASMAGKMYPYINEKTSESLQRSEIKSIFKDCSALILYRLNNVVLKATDNIILSTFMGLETVGMYSNYYILYTAINSLFSKVFNSVSHSLGNLHTGSDRNHEYDIFEIAMLISAILGGTAGVGIFICADELVQSWIGKGWVLAQPFSLLMGLEIYTLCFRVSLSKYRSAMGLFQQAKYRPLAGMIINLIVSVLLVKRWGICGVLVGTIVADWTTMMWFDPIIIHKYGFEEIVSPMRYFSKFIFRFSGVCVVACLDYIICTHVLCGYSWFSVFVHALICGLSVPTGLLLISYKTDEGKYILNLLKKYRSRIVCRLQK